MYYWRNAIRLEVSLEHFFIAECRPSPKLKAPFGLDQTFALVFVGLPRLQ